MRKSHIGDLSVARIMQRWPSTIQVFIDLRMHCIGCPIAPFHTLGEAAAEHGLSLDAVLDAVSAKATPAAVRRR